jgi:hypothetical protein
MSHAYTEDQLVEQPAIGLFAALGWQTISALEETFGTAGTLGRETKTRGLSLGFVRSRRDPRGGEHDLSNRRLRGTVVALRLP